MSVRRALLDGVVDYAGTYPPASLSTAEAIAEYAAASQSPHAWMLGRLVWPASRLDALAGKATGWHVSAVISDQSELQSLQSQSSAEYIVDAVEVRAATVGDLAQLAAILPRDAAIYIEVGSVEDPAVMLGELKKRGWNAKIRTGGVTAEAFPSPASVLRFVGRCSELDVSFKATAGLHHPVAGQYPLTYEPGCPRGSMFGFLNLLVATALLERREASCAALALEEVDPLAFTLSDECVRWKDRELGPADVAAARRRLHSFGSCSFREPVDDLLRIGGI